MSENFWQDKYGPLGIDAALNLEQYPNLQAVFRESSERFADRPAYSNLGHTLTYREVYQHATAFAAYLQHHTSLRPGDRISIQMPNILQYPVVLIGALRAGMVVVNTNPLYTERELEHQLSDSGAKAVVCLANMAHMVEKVLDKTALRHIIVTDIGDLLPAPKRWVVNAVVRHVKKLVPAYNLPNSVTFSRAMAQGRKSPLTEYNPDRHELAILQYTGGTTGVAKGAMLSHHNLIANMMQCASIMSVEFVAGQEVVIAPLPLYHIYAFTFFCMAGTYLGCHNVLITNPRDIKAFVSDLKKYPFTALVGLNTLFVALMNNEEFAKMDFSKLRMTVSGGMALQSAVVKRWENLTGTTINEGYGLTETSPVVAVNPLGYNQVGTIGLPVPLTECRTINESGEDVPLGERGELVVRGPQVMMGYWQREDATKEVLSDDGWLETGDIAVIQPDGYIRIVDRKKDMIVVSGFNVYPNELEDILVTLPAVLQCAAIGVPDEKTGERVKLFVVVRDGFSLTEQQVIDFMHDQVTAYKRPREVEFRSSLPVTNVGKILRRELRDEVLQKAKQVG